MARLTTLIALGLAASLAAATAQAAEGRFIHPADTNKDDRISRQEWAAYKLPAAEFDKADANSDGQIDGPEFVAWRQTQG
ncbi:MAG: hypothetical protein Q7S93_18465 [Phenylobacterium sp.]|uniref:hypothetical protein n=1 Tax=Phenylobacterium sp. TaxID=1871053 RepID=UPI0027224924|nr:hypothetical protein [Phenylobacterium sp.]MDO8412041.1 hypothetical protein [Phenylobacterium sp.]